MTDDKFKTCEHFQYGIGTAILIKHRRKTRDDLFMCSFGKIKTFYCRKHFDVDGEIWFSDGKKRKITQNVKSRAEEIEDQLRAIFGVN